MCIRYSIVNCPLGRLLVAASEKGVCAVSIGKSDRVLQAALFREYPAAEIHKARTGLNRYLTAILKYFGGKRLSPDLPLDVHVTAFQGKVYEALRAIPFGHTDTYSGMARAIGHPRAARAVARACATNPAAILIPCHRAVQKGGDPGGYRWGRGRKKTLLAKEQGGNIEMSSGNGPFHRKGPRKPRPQGEDGELRSAT